MRDDVDFYERVGKGWRRYENANQINQFKIQREQNVDTRQCHPIDGKVEEGRLHTHMKYNMVDELKEGSQGKAM